MNHKELPPYSCQYSPSVVGLLKKLKVSIALSTYQANKLIFISPSENSRLVQLARNFDKVMGFQFNDKALVMATRNKVHLFNNSPRLAKTYPKKPQVYDGLFLPRQTFYTGQVDVHDIHYENEEIFGVNTSFSTVVKLGASYNWEPIWTPPIISSFASEDRCHLNGFCFRDGKLRYATSLGGGNTIQSWRDTIPGGGILWDVIKGQPIFDNLQMPHSPRIYKDKLYFLESATGTVNMMDLKSEKIERISSMNAFVRGLTIYRDFLFVGKSKLRASNRIFKDLDMAKKKIQAGIAIIHLPTKKFIGEINYLNSVEEIYDVQILAGSIRPNVLSPEDDYHLRSLSIPGATFWAKSNGDGGDL